MAKSYYSVVLDHSADAVWSVIRQFGHYSWAGVKGETVLEDGKAGDQVGAVRRVTTEGNLIRQVLLAHSDITRSYSYRFVDAPPVPDYEATIRITPVVEGGKSFVEWWATFDCDVSEKDKWIHRFENQGFALWLAGLRAFMSGHDTA